MPRIVNERLSLIVSRLVRAAVRACVALAAISLVAFAAVSAPPGDFFSDAALRTTAAPETIQRWRERFGTDRPLPERYARWAASVLRGEAGISIAYGLPVAALFRSRAARTAVLDGVALGLSWAIALVGGVWSATRATRWDGRAIAAGAATLMGIPDLVLAVGLLVAAASLGWLPTSGLLDDRAGAGGLLARALDGARHLALPLLALTASLTPVLLRHVRNCLQSVLHAPFLAAQRARGVPMRRIVWRSALRAASPPLVALLGLSFASAFSASLVIEVAFGWPGLGPLILDAVHARDPHVVLAGVMCSATLLVGGNLLATALLAVADPRIGEGGR